MDYRIFRQGEKWANDGVYSDLVTMTPEELFRTLEGLFCGAERYYQGMKQWYQNRTQQILPNESVSRLLGFFMDYHRMLNAAPHEWLRDSPLCQALEKRLKEKELIID